jgi:fatty acid desaturase
MDRPTIDAQLMSELTTVSRWRSIAACVLLWAVILGVATAGALVLRTPEWYLAIPLLVVITGLQHHLLIIAHDGSHGLVHPSLRINDLAVDFFCAVPFVSILRFYRTYHLLHHKHQGTDEDSEVKFYRTQFFDDCRRGLVPYWKLFLADFLGLAPITMLIFYMGLVRGWVKEKRVDPLGLRDLLLFALFWGPVVYAAVHFDVWRELLIFWFAPLLLLGPLFKTRGYGEHTLYEGEDEYLRTWTHQVNPIEKFFIFPLNIGYHLEHHLFPRVPWYNLPRLRKALIEQVPGYVEGSAPVTVRSYLFDRKSMLRRMIRRERGNPGEAARVTPSPRS